VLLIRWGCRWQIDEKGRLSVLLSSARTSLCRVVLDSLSPWGTIPTILARVGRTEAAVDDGPPAHLNRVLVAAARLEQHFVAEHGRKTVAHVRLLEMCSARSEGLGRGLLG